MQRTDSDTYASILNANQGVPCKTDLPSPCKSDDSQVEELALLLDGDAYVELRRPALTKESHEPLEEPQTASMPVAAFGQNQSDEPRIEPVVELFVDDILAPEPSRPTNTSIAAKHRGGRPKGSTSKAVRCRTLPVHRAGTDEQVHRAVQDLLWRKREDGTSSSCMRADELARHIIYKGKPFKLGESGQVIAIIYKTPLVRTIRKENGLRGKVVLCMMDANQEWIDRVSWYWRGELWSERAILEESGCKLSRTALRKRLRVEGLSVEEANIETT